MKKYEMTEYEAEAEFVSKLISTRIPTELWERLEKYIEQNGQTKQWLISRALDVYLKRWSGSQPPTNKFVGQQWLRINGNRPRKRKKNV